MQFTELTTEAEVLDLITWHNANSQHVTLDTETTGLDPHTDTVTDIILYGKTPNSASLFCGDFARCLNRLRVPTVVFQNFKFDARMLFKAGVDIRNFGSIRDTMLLHHLEDENADHSLDSIVVSRYGDTYKSRFWGEFKSYSEAPRQRQLGYACKDVIYTDLLYRDLCLSLERAGIPTSLIAHTHNLALALYDTELKGLKVDLQYLTTLGVELKPKIVEFQHTMRGLVDTQCSLIEFSRWAKAVNKAYKPRGRKWRDIPMPEFNWDSHAQVGELLYERLGLPEQRKKDRKSKEWRRTTDDDALEKIEHLHAVVPMLREYAGYQKVYTAFIEGTLERLRNGRIYPGFNVNGTVTGRISSSDPNMQQLPSKGEWAKVRGIYIPDSEDHCIISCDYSQLEVVIAAHFSHDPNLLKIVYEGVSKHDITAAGVGLPRDVAKTLNFAMQYQCTPIKVQQIVGCSLAEAGQIWDKYWETYAFEKRVIEECEHKVDSGEPIINPFGRRRHFKGTYSKWQREAAYRQAYSSLIQGTGSDCTHYAFYTVANELAKRGWGRALFEVHDEIVICVHKRYCQEASEMLKYTMIQAGKVANLSVPLSVECSEPLERWAK